MYIELNYLAGVLLSTLCVIFITALRRKNRQDLLQQLFIPKYPDSGENYVSLLFDTFPRVHILEWGWKIDQ